MKKPIALAILVIGIVLALAYFAAPGNKVHLSDVYDSSFDEVEEVEIVDGTTGESATISGKEEIQRFLGQMEKMEWQEDRWAEDKEGYLWAVRIKSEDEEFHILSYQMDGRKFKHNPEFNDLAASFYKK